MKLVRQTLLQFRQGGSDKVYEVDLCEVGPGRFVVNYRYGRRGSRLKEGSQTVAPVAQAEAQRAFDELVQSKIKKGYQQVVAGQAASSPSPSTSTDRRVDAILLRLSRGGSEQPRKGAWPLERVIWRAGELRLRGAVPYLVQLLGASPLRDYCVAGALGQCAEPGDRRVMEVLGGLYSSVAGTPAVRRIAGEALCLLSDEATKAEMQADLATRLPAELRPDILYQHYCIDSAAVRPALLEVLRTAPLERPGFQQLRYIFKAAEYRRDAEVFGLLAHRFETAHPSKGAFGAATRMYLRRRVWRALRSLGQQGELAYVNMAVGVLLPFTDADAKPEKGTGRVRWGPFAGYWAFNHILYGGSRRVVPQRNGKAFHTVRVHGEAQGREEAFPGLWEKRPEGLLHVLSESRCLPVHQFAVKALRACPGVLRELDVDAVLMLLSRPYEVTAGLGLELARQRYQAAAPDLQLVLALAGSVLREARQEAMSYIDAGRGHFLGDGDFVLALIFSPHEDVRTFARRLLLSSTFIEDSARALIARIVANLLALGAGAEARARDIGDLLLSVFARPLREVGMQVLLDLLSHPMKEVQEIGGKLVLQLPDDKLLLGGALLLSLCAHPLPELRHATRPVVKRLAAEHPLFGERLVAGLTDALRAVSKEQEELARHLLRMLQEDLLDHAEHLPRETALLLCAARTAPAQELGGLLLQRHLEWADEIDTPALARLASHDVLSVREACFAMFGRVLPRLRRNHGEMARAVRLLDAKWDDARAFAFGIFRESFDGEDFTPGILVGICDSVREDVQRFGRELCTRYFAEENGQEYLLKLSQHPSAELQLHATNYLERYAAGSIERLRELRPYFLSVLSRVNRGRVAKERVFAFLAEEGVRSEEAARLVAEILGRQSVTMAIADRARAIEAMLRISCAHPGAGVALPLLVHPTAVRHAV